MSSYIDHQKRRLVVGGFHQVVVTHSWAEFTANRLIWLYGPKRAASIIAGRDPKANADLKARRELGGNKGGTPVGAMMRP